MDKKGGMNELVMNNIIYLIFIALFVISLGAFVFNQVDGAAVWEDYYAKEITKVINLASPGDEIVLDVHRGTEIGRGNGVESFNDMFRIDNGDNEVCVRLSSTRRTCYNYFNDVDVEWELRLGVPVNLLKLKVVEGRENE